MTRLTRLTLAALLPLSTASLVAAQAPLPGYALPGQDDPVERLGRYLRVLSSSPRDLGALTGAGRAALDVGDAAAAIGFFGRAEEIAPRDGRVKAGLGSALVQMEQPAQALKLFDQAVDFGVAPATIAADRGLAHDLRGENKRAQADYALALRTAYSDETVRRLALSQAMSGDRTAALATLDPLLRKQDKAAWRASTFVLALTGDPRGATERLGLLVPAGQASQIAPFLAKLATLRSGEQAQAVHFGHLPSSAAPRGTALAGATTQPLPGQTLTPAGTPLGRSYADARSTTRATPAEPTRTLPPRTAIPAASGYTPPPAATAFAANSTVLPSTMVPAASSAVAARAVPAQSAPPTPRAAPSAGFSPLASTAPARVAPSPTAPPGSLASAPATPTPAAPIPAAPPTAITAVALPASSAAAPPVQVAASTAPAAARSVEPGFSGLIAAAEPVAAAPPPVRLAQADPAAATVPLWSRPERAAPAQDKPAPATVPLWSKPERAASAPANPAPATVPLWSKPARDAAAPARSSAARPSADDTSTSKPARPKPTRLAATEDEPDTPATRSGRKASAAKDADAPAAKTDRKGRTLLAAADQAVRKGKGAADEGDEPTAKPSKGKAAQLTAAEKKKADKAAADKKKADEAKATKLAETKAAAAKAKKEPERHWVQVATGAYKGDLAKAWSKVKADHPQTMAGKSAWTTPLRFTNRVLVGPFKSADEAQAFVNANAKAGFTTSRFTSTAGQPVERLGGK